MATLGRGGDHFSHCATGCYLDHKGDQEKNVLHIADSEPQSTRQFSDAPCGDFVHPERHWHEDQLQRALVSSKWIETHEASIIFNSANTPAAGFSQCSRWPSHGSPASASPAAAQRLCRLSLPRLQQGEIELMTLRESRWIRALSYQSDICNQRVPFLPGPHNPIAKWKKVPRPYPKESNFLRHFHYTTGQLSP